MPSVTTTTTLAGGNPNFKMSAGGGAGSTLPLANPDDAMAMQPEKIMDPDADDVPMNELEGGQAEGEGNNNGGASNSSSAATGSGGETGAHAQGNSSASTNASKPSGNNQQQQPEQGKLPSSSSTGSNLVTYASSSGDSLSIASQPLPGAAGSVAGGDLAALNEMEGVQQADAMLNEALRGGNGNGEPQSAASGASMNSVGEMPAVAAAQASSSSSSSSRAMSRNAQQMSQDDATKQLMADNLAEAAANLNLASSQSQGPSVPSRGPSVVGANGPTGNMMLNNNKNGRTEAPTSSADDGVGHGNGNGDADKDDVDA